MKIVCSRHADMRLQERFGVRWSLGLEVDLSEQLLDSPGPLGTAELRGRGEPEGTTYWAVKIDGMSGVLVITDQGVIRTVLRQLDIPKRPKRQKRRVRKRPTSGSQRRPVIDPYTDDD